MILTKKDIEKLLPHRDPFLFLDNCKIIEVGTKGIGYKKFLLSEYFFKGHFPENPIVPGVVLVETLAQTAGTVVSAGFDNNTEKSVLFMNITKAKFRKPVLPNENIEFHVEIINKVKSVYKFGGKALKENIVVCEAEFSALIIEGSIKEIL